MADILPVVRNPITCAPQFMVSCSCGWAHDSAHGTEAEVLAWAATEHNCPVNDFLVEPVNYADHPIYVEHARRCRKCRAYVKART